MKSKPTENKKVSKKTSKKFIGTTVLYDENGTGMTVGLVNVNTSTFKNWQRCWMNDLAAVINLLGEAKVKVFTYILTNTHRVTNEFGGTVREISEATGASTKTVQEVINKLVASGFMRKKRVATYMVNPEIINYGSDKSVGYLLIQYSNLAEPTPIEQAIKEREKRKKLEEEINQDSEKYNRPRITVQD